MRVFALNRKRLAQDVEHRAMAVAISRRISCADASLQYVARQADCRACPIRQSCLTAKERRKHVKVNRYEYEFRRARQLNQTVRYQREMRRRKTAVEGVFARFDRLAWEKAKFRGIERLDCQGTIAALAHNILKALT